MPDGDNESVIMFRYLRVNVLERAYRIKLSARRGLLSYLAADAARAAFLAALAFLCFTVECFLTLVAGLDVAFAGAVAVAALAASGATPAGACAKETAATLESKATAIRDLILNMIGTLKTTVAVAPTV